VDPLLIVFGLGVGLLVGISGVGGGSVMTPLLILVLGVSPITAVGTDLAYGAVTKTLGGWQHFRQGSVSTRLSAWLAVGSVPGALAGVITLGLLYKSYGEELGGPVMVAVAAAVALTAAVVLARALFMPRAQARERSDVEMTPRRKATAALIGVSVGFVLGVTSIGSGALIAVALILVFRLTPRRVVGTDVFHAAILLWVAAFAHVVAGNVDFVLMATILIGSLPGVYVGARISDKLPGTSLRLALATVLIAAALGLASKAGADIPAPVIVLTPPVVVSGAYAASRLRTPRAEREPVASTISPS
jgi:uncharacterized protein